VIIRDCSAATKGNITLAEFTDLLPTKMEMAWLPKGYLPWFLVEKQQKHYPKSQGKNSLDKCHFCI